MLPTRQQINEIAARQDAKRKEMEASRTAEQREQEEVAAEMIQVSNLGTLKASNIG